MTDEEMAEKWVIVKTGFNPKEPLGRITVRTFMAGLKAGKDMVETDLETIAYMQGAERYKTKWHDLQKDPNDVPNDCRYVWTNVGAGYHDNDGWWDDFGRLQNVIAWCEPKFEE